MIISKVCIVCGKEFKVPHWRKDTAKYCGVVCQHKSLKAKPNLICPICGKRFHRKRSHINRFKGDFGFCCSKKCDTEVRRLRMTGENNHQYGLKGELNASFKDGDSIVKNNSITEVFVYVGNWYKRSHNCGRIPRHRYLVELNYSIFGEENFEFIDGWHYLNKGLSVHHKDCNHSNNSIDNLQVLSKAEHRRLHNLLKPRSRDVRGRFQSNIN